MKTKVIQLVFAILVSNAVFASGYSQNFCRKNDIESLKLQIDLNDKEIHSTLTYVPKNSPPEVQKYIESLYSRVNIDSDDIAYLTNQLLRWEDFSTEIISGLRFIGADDPTDESTVNRIYYVIKDDKNTEYVFVKNTGLYYFGSSANCLSLQGRVSDEL